MKDTLVTIGTAAVVGLFASWCLINYAPLSLFSGSTKPLFGNTSITTIQGSDTLSASRTTLNNNFASLNANKVEISDLAATTSLQQLTTTAALATVGTITVGTWHGSIVFPTWGGTGSSTLSQYQILLGNGTGAVTVPVGWGTSGQSFVSNGAGVLPSWQSASFDTTLAYILTGTWNFGNTVNINNATLNATGTSMFKNLNASSTVANPIKLNGVSINTPSTQGANHTTLVNDGSGNLTWSVPLGTQYEYASTTSTVPANTTETSPTIISIPSGLITASSTIEFMGAATCVTGGSSLNACTITLAVNGNTLASFNARNMNGGSVDCVALSNTCRMTFRGTITSNNATNAQIGFLSLLAERDATQLSYHNSQSLSSSVDLSGTDNFTIQVATDSGASNSTVFIGFTLIVRP